MHSIRTFRPQHAYVDANARHGSGGASPYHPPSPYQPAYAPAADLDFCRLDCRFRLWNLIFRPFKPMN